MQSKQAPKDHTAPKFESQNSIRHKPGDARRKGVTRDLTEFSVLHISSSTHAGDSYRLMADLRGSPIVAKGSRAPSFSAIHFFSLAMISSSRSLSSAVGIAS